MNPTYVALLANFGVLLLCGLLVTSVSQIWNRRRLSGLSGQITSGLVFGATTVTLILLSTAFIGGAIFDARAAPAILSGIIGGPWAALVTALMGAAARLHVGGDWVVNGVISVFAYCAAGAAAGPLLRRFFGRDLSLAHMAPMTAIITTLTLTSLFVGQPLEAARQLYETVYFKVLLTNVTSVLGLSLLVMNSARTAADQEQLRMMRAAVTRATNGVVITDASAQRRIIFANDAVTRMFGYANDQLVGQSTDIFFGPDADSQKRQTFRDTSKSGREVTETFINYRSDGAPFHNQVTLTPIFSVDGELTHFLAVLSDVTKEVEARRTLKTVAGQIPLALIYTNRDGDVEYINDAAADLFGETARSAETQKLQTVIGRDLAEGFAPWIEAAIAGGEIKREQQLSITGADDIHARLVFAPTVSENGERVGVIISIEDITAYKQMEAALAQSQRLQSIGTLTGGIAHDFNNLNTVVIGNLDLLKLSEPNAEAAEFIEEALTAARRGAKLTQSLLTFGRKAMLQPDRIDLARGFGDLEHLIRSSIRKSTSIEFLTKAEALEVDVDRTNLESAILNLVVNADHAIGDRGGAIRIDVHEQVLDAAPQDGAFAGDFEVDATGRFAAISVSDDGPGVPAKDRDKIIEPFFTTKGRHSGTGLGLAMVHGFVRQSGGFMRITENQPTGVVVTLYLPLSETEAKSESASTAERAAALPMRKAG